MKDLTGMRFGKWEVLGFALKKRRESFYKCKCECGKIFIVRKFNLVHNKSSQCISCANKGINSNTYVHGLALKHPLYGVWMSTKDRCRNPKNPSYHNYGGRGISISEEWQTNFKTFYDWAIANGWQKGLQIDRIDNNKGYSPDNCRWVTSTANNRNTRRNVINLGKAFCIKAYIAKGLPLIKIRDIFNINFSTISDIKHNRTWRSI